MPSGLAAQLEHVRHNLAAHRLLAAFISDLGWHATIVTNADDHTTCDTSIISE